MDETPKAPKGADERYREQVVAENHWFQLVDTAEGYGIWARGSARSEPAVEAFAAEDFEAANLSYRRRTRQMRGFVTAPRWLAWVVFVVAPMWAVTTAVDAVWSLVGAQDLRFFEDRPFPPRWLQYVQQVSNAVWLAAIACLISLYLYRRASALARG